MRGKLLPAIALGLSFAAVVPITESSADKPRHQSVVWQLKTNPDRKGEILCALYRNEKSWLSDKPFRATSTPAGAKWSTCRFVNVPTGTYAMAALHDEDGDREMDKNFLGLPTEGYAASRDAHLKGFGAPDWEDAIFRHNQGRTTQQRAKVKY